MATKKAAIDTTQAPTYKFAWSKARVRITGTTPMLMHRAGDLVDPTSETKMAMASITGKNKKSQDDHFAVRRIEWMDALWLNDAERICIPRHVLLASIRESAKTWRLGSEIMRSVEIPEDALLEYDGPDDPEKLWERPTFRDVRSVVVNNSRVMRCRPKFSKWEAEFTIMWLSEFLDSHMIPQFLANAGFRYGIGDFRPSYGRFSYKILSTD